MKPSRAVLGVTLIALLACPMWAAGQPVTAVGLPRAEASGLVGWFSANEEQVKAHDDWYHRSWSADVSIGYYWTEHLKTEITGGMTSEGELWGVRISPLGGVYSPVVHQFSTRAVGIGQQYQFGHNAWFHPYLGGGVALEWVRQTEEREPTYQFGRSGSSPFLIEPARTIGPKTDARARPFVNSGFKAYMTERSFFRSDVRVAFEHDVKDVGLRVGFGVDF